MTNVRVIRDAWAAFAVWCVIALVVSWWLQGWIYETRLNNAASSISTLTTQVGALTGRLTGAEASVDPLNATIAGLRAQVAALSAQTTAKAWQPRTLKPDQITRFRAAALAHSGARVEIVLSSRQCTDCASYRDSFYDLIATLPTWRALSMGVSLGFSSDRGITIRYDDRGEAAVTVLADCLNAAGIGYSLDRSVEPLGRPVILIVGAE